MTEDPLEPFITQVRSAMHHACKVIGYPVPEEIRPDEGYGDIGYACFSLARNLKENPEKVAEEIMQRIPPGDLFTVESKNGYINFRFNDERLALATVRCVLSRKERYGYRDQSAPSILIEHTSANPTGPLHVGRARNPIIGDTLARLLEAAGHSVTREYFINDVGRQVATLTWGYLNLQGDTNTPEGLVELYRKASALEEKDENVREGISEILRKIEARDESILSSVRHVCTIMMDKIFRDLELINVRFDRATWESDLILHGDTGDVIERLKPYLKEKDGTKYIELDENETLTLLRADGTTLYPLRDIIYHLDKGSRADIMINVIGEDHRLEMKGVVTMLTLLHAKVPELIFYSMVSLPEGRMSTRTGNVVYLKDLVNEAVERASLEVRKRHPNMDESTVRRISHSIGAGAVRFNILRIQAEKSFIFRWEEALNFEGESAPYAQYAHARCMSIFARASEMGIWTRGPDMDGSGFIPADTDQYTMGLIRTIARLPSLITELAERRDVHLIPAYASLLADRFNQYYEHIRVLDSENWRSRLELIAATRWTLKNVLELMGIDPVKEM